MLLLGNEHYPLVSVVLPTFQSAATLRETIESVRLQTYSNWELLIIDEAGTDDGTRNIATQESREDDRIHLLVNERKLGLAESLNRGIREASGQYIARVDSDDRSVEDRFEKQVSYLSQHPEIDIVGGWQQHYGGKVSTVHKAAADEQECRARMLFHCDLCHSTVMMRRDFLIQHKLFYDSRWAQEDWTLWLRALEYGRIANIPEVLGDHRVTRNNLTAHKLPLIMEQSGELTALALKKYLDLELSREYWPYLRHYLPPASFMIGHKQREALGILRNLVVRIRDANLRTGYCRDEVMIHALYRFWSQSVRETYVPEEEMRARTLEDVFSVVPRRPSVRNMARHFVIMHRNDYLSEGHE